VDSPSVPSKGRASKQVAQPPPKVPRSAIIVARIGGTLAMIPAAAISAQTLFRLGRMMNLASSIAWLLPAALDIYAVTSIWVGFQVPEGHPARKSAIWNARFALALTVICNALSHALNLASMKHGWSRQDLALTLVSALPPIVVERLLHLQTMIATGEGADSATAGKGADDRRQNEVPTRPADADKTPAVPTPTPAQTPTATINGTTARADKTADIIDLSAAGDAVRRSLPAWVELALPLYRHHVKTFGSGPTAPQLATLLGEAGHGQPGKSRARDVRAATAEAAEDSGAKTTEPDRELIGARR
jgi:hypothetical protein